MIKRTNIMALPSLSERVPGLNELKKITSKALRPFTSGKNSVQKGFEGHTFRTFTLINLQVREPETDHTQDKIQQVQSIEPEDIRKELASEKVPLFP